MPVANVDKRSFINAKRRQIHETRAVRKQNITNIRKELSMNEVLLKRLTKLISTMESASGSRSPEEIVLQALVDLSSEEGDEKTPPLPPNTPTYAQMMASLVDSIKREIDQEMPDDRFKAFLDKLREHKVKLTEVYNQSGKRLAELEKEDNAKITSDHLHDGFSAGHVNKTVQFPTASEKKKKPTQKVQAVERLNPGVNSTDSRNDSPSSGADADLEESAEDDNEDHIEPTKLGKEFAKIKIGDYRKCMEYVSRNPAVVAERETDGLLIEAFNSQIDGRDDYAKQCVHQALLLQYCRQLGRDGVALFFKRHAVFHQLTYYPILTCLYLELQHQTIKHKRSSMKMSRLPINVFVNVPRLWPKSETAKQQELNRSSCMP